VNVGTVPVSSDVGYMWKWDGIS